MTKRILTLVLAACLLIVPVFADDADSVAVSTLEELQAAITAAQDGDTIILTEIIMLSEDAVIGEEGKRVKLVCEGEFARNFINIYSGNITLQGLIFEGFTEDSAINHYDGTLTCRDCEFLRCRGGIYSYGKPEYIENCRFETCYSPISGAKDLTMQGCSVVNCTGAYSCVSASGSIVIDGCRFEKNIVPADTGALYAQSGNTQITNSAFIGNHAILGRGAAIYSDGDITISGCVFHDNRAGTEGNDLYIRNCDLTVADTAQELEELYAVQSLDYTGIYTDYISARQGEALNLPLSYTLSNTDSAIAICFVSSEHVEPTPTPEPVVKTEYVYVPVYQTEIVEVEKVIEVEPEKETVEFQGVTLQRNDDYMRGYFDSLKGQDATRAKLLTMAIQTFPLPLHTLRRSMRFPTPACFADAAITALSRMP